MTTMMYDGSHQTDIPRTYTCSHDLTDLARSVGVRRRQSRDGGGGGEGGRVLRLPPALNVHVALRRQLHLNMCDINILDIRITAR